MGRSMQVKFDDISAGDFKSNDAQTWFFGQLEIKIASSVTFRHVVDHQLVHSNILHYWQMTNVIKRMSKYGII